MKLLIVILVLAIVLIAGCTQLSAITCTPNWIKSQFIDNMIIQVQSLSAGDYCKTQCYNAYKTTSIKVENATQSLTNSTGFYCYCDVNNCNP